MNAIPGSFKNKSVGLVADRELNAGPQAYALVLICQLKIQPEILQAKHHKPHQTLNYL